MNYKLDIYAPSEFKGPILHSLYKKLRENNEKFSLNVFCANMHASLYQTFYSLNKYTDCGLYYGEPYGRKEEDNYESVLLFESSFQIFSNNQEHTVKKLSEIDDKIIKWDNNAPNNALYYAWASGFLKSFPNKNSRNITSGSCMEIIANTLGAEEKKYALLPNYYALNDNIAPTLIDHTIPGEDVYFVWKKNSDKLDKIEKIKNMLLEITQPMRRAL